MLAGAEHAQPHQPTPEDRIEPARLYLGKDLLTNGHSELAGGKQPQEHPGLEVTAAGRQGQTRPVHSLVGDDPGDVADLAQRATGLAPAVAAADPVARDLEAHVEEQFLGRGEQMGPGGGGPGPPEIVDVELTALAGDHDVTVKLDHE
jgi:hypothetical protein